MDESKALVSILSIFEVALGLLVLGRAERVSGLARRPDCELMDALPLILRELSSVFLRAILWEPFDRIHAPLVINRTSLLKFS